MKTRFILVADNSDVIVDALRKELAATTYALLHAKNGQEALDYLELLESEIALLIIELELPVVSGLDVIWHLVNKKRPKQPKIIATSFVEVPNLKQAITKFGVDAVVQIPMDAKEWHKTVEEVLGNSSQASAAGT
jgi:CheY-like chemotaxis protein